MRCQHLISRVTIIVAFDIIFIAINITLIASNEIIIRTKSETMAFGIEIKK